MENSTLLDAHVAGLLACAWRRRFEDALPRSSLGRFTVLPKLVNVDPPPATRIVLVNCGAETLARQVAARRVAARKVAARKVTARKVAVRKVAARKVAARKVAARKVAARKVAARKVVAPSHARRKLQKNELAPCRNLDLGIGRFTLYYTTKPTGLAVCFFSAQPLALKSIRSNIKKWILISPWHL